jgi:8-oxo-dGTP diphosphatase
MTKIAAAVIRSDDKILLIRCASGQQNAGCWEFPSEAVKPGERITQSLKHKLKKELNIDANIGNMTTSITFRDSVIYVYDVKSFKGNIVLSTYNASHWVEKSKLAEYKMSPLDKKIAAFITKTKENKESDNDKITSAITAFIFSKVLRPTFNKESNKWEVVLNKKDDKEIKLFATERQAIDFYVQEARKVLGFAQAKVERQH